MEILKGKRLLLLGGSLWSDIISDFAKRNEIVLLATGNNHDARIFQIATECYDVDSTNDEMMKELIISERIDGVYMGGSESVILAAVRYLNDLNMPCYCTENQWKELQDKRNFKSLCIKHGLPVAQQYEVTLDDIKNKSVEIEFPVITKPSDGSGSSGFSVCHNFRQLKSGYEKAKNSSPTDSVIVERFVKNDSVVVFYTFSNGEMYFSGIEDKYPVEYKEHGSFVAGMHIFESRKKDDFRRKFENKIREMCSSLQIKEGSIWMEIFYDGANFYFNEAGYRYSGSVSVYPVDYFYKINQVATDMYFALTGKSCLKGLGSVFDNLVPRKKHYCIYSIHLKPGQIKGIEGIKRVLEINNVVALPTTMSVGDVVIPSGTVGQVFAFVHFVYDSDDEFRDIIDKVRKTISIMDIKGQNMVAHLLDLSSASIREKT